MRGEEGGERADRNKLPWGGVSAAPSCQMGFIYPAPESTDEREGARAIGSKGLVGPMYSAVDVWCSQEMLGYSKIDIGFWSKNTYTNVNAIITNSKINVFALWEWNE